MNKVFSRAMVVAALCCSLLFFAKNNDDVAILMPEIETETIEPIPMYTAGVETTIIESELSEQEKICSIAQNEFLAHMETLETIENDDLKQWYLEYKEMIARYSDRVDPPETIYDYFIADEIDILTHVVQAEIGDEYSFSQKCNVASVILNRLHHESFENDLDGILTESQFATIRNGRYKKVNVSEDTILACEYVFEIGDTTGGALFFDSDGSLHYKYMFSDGAHNFYKKRGE